VEKEYNRCHGSGFEAPETGRTCHQDDVCLGTASERIGGGWMELLDIVCVVVVTASTIFVFILMTGTPVYSRYGRWKEKRAFRLRDRRDAGMKG